MTPQQSIAHQKSIAFKLGHQNLKQYNAWIISKYFNEMKCGQEIADEIRFITGEKITARAIQRTVQRSLCVFGDTRKSRETGEAFRNAISRGRVQWAYKIGKIKRKSLNPSLRLRILKRDNYKCVLCGHGVPQGALLEVDHELAVCFGGLTIESNLRTLCHACNVGKRINNKEI